MQNLPDELSASAFLARTAKHWKAAVSVSACMFAVAAAAVMLLPNGYRTHLKVLVKSERVEPSISMDRQAQQAVSPVGVTEAQINTEIQLMTSADVLRQVVARCKLADRQGDGRGGGKVSEEGRNEMALRRLEKELTVAAIHGSNVIDASYESSDAGRATSVLDALSDVYLASHRELNRTLEPSSALQSLSHDYAAELAEAEEALSSFARSHQIVTLSEQKTMALANINRLEGKIQDGAAAVKKNAQTAKHLRLDIDRMPTSIERQRRSIPNAVAVEQLTQALLGLENKRAAARLRYQPQERTMIELDDQIARTQTALHDARTSTVEEISMGADPAVDTARGEYLRVAAEEAGDEAQTQESVHQLAADRARLTALEAQSNTYHELQRKVASLEELGDASRRAAESARITQMLEEQSGVNLAVVERPFQLALPTSPKRGLLLMLGLLWSVGLGLATAVMLEVFTTRIRTPFELAQASGLPVLAAIPSKTIPQAEQASFPALMMAMRRDVPRRVA